jgi:hypothetical protein
MRRNTVFLGGTICNFSVTECLLERYKFDYVSLFTIECKTHYFVCQLDMRQLATINNHFRDNTVTDLCLFGLATKPTKSEKPWLSFPWKDSPNSGSAEFDVVHRDSEYSCGCDGKFQLATSYWCLLLQFQVHFPLSSLVFHIFLSFLHKAFHSLAADKQNRRKKIIESQKRLESLAQITKHNW